MYTLETLKTPSGNMLLDVARAYPVRAGDRALFPADLEDRSLRWVEA